MPSRTDRASARARLRRGAGATSRVEAPSDPREAARARVASRGASRAGIRKARGGELRALAARRAPRSKTRRVRARATFEQTPAPADPWTRAQPCHAQNRRDRRPDARRSSIVRSHRSSVPCARSPARATLHCRANASLAIPSPREVGDCIASTSARRRENGRKPGAFEAVDNSPPPIRELSIIFDLSPA